MSKMSSVLLSGFLAAWYFYSETIYATDSPTLRVDSKYPMVISVIDNESSSPVSLPVGFSSEINETYSDVYVEDLSGDGIGEIIVRLSVNDVNTCSRVLRYNKNDRSLSEVVFEGGVLCNFKVRNGYVISSYKDGPFWKEDAYSLRLGRVKRVVSDSCIGCGEVFRKKYDSNGSVVRFMVSDEPDFENRTPLTAKIRSLRAEVYSVSDAVKPVGFFLTRGEDIFVLGFDKGLDGKEVVEFRSSENPNVYGWLKCSDLDCDEL